MDNKKIKILAIDDNRDNLISLKAIISEEIPQSVVYMELSGKSGIESARRNDPDVILLDIVMPGMDGYQVCKTLKADEQLSDTPIIFVTALNGDKQSRILALEAGGEAFLSKPIDATELKAQILAMLKIKEAAAYKKDQRLHLEVLVQKRTEELKGANIAALNLLEDLNNEIEIRKQREEALKESEKQYAFLAGTAFDLVKFTSIQNIYEYTAFKLYELMDDKGIVAIVEYDTNSNLWKMQHLKGIDDKYADLSKIFGFDIRKLEGEISTKYYEKITSGKLEEVELDFPGHFKNKVSDKIGNTVMKLLSLDKMYCISFHSNEQIFGNITLVTKKNSKPLNADLIEAFVLQVTNYIKKQKSEEALRISKELLSETESIGKVGGWSFNIDTKEQKWTDEVYRIHEVEISPEPDIDAGINYYTKESRPIIMKAVQRAIEHGENYDLELDIITAKGNTRAVHTIGKADFKNRRIYGFFQDITERKQAEEKLKLLNRAVEASSVAVEITDAEGNINYVNPFFTELTGYSYEEVLGKNPRFLNSGTHPKTYFENLWSTILSGKDWTGEFQNKKKNGALYWEKVVISPILNSNGKITNFVAIKDDITERKKILKELVDTKEHAEESDRLKSAFLANMSHEIRTPMNGILGFSDLLRNPQLSSDEKESYIEILHLSGQRMLNTVNDIIEISKIESGMVLMNPAIINVNSKLKEHVHFFAREASAKGLELMIEKLLPESSSAIVTDQVKLDSILSNLIKNAIKYTDNGSIKIGCLTKGNHLEFYILDTGIGIPVDRRKAIFDRFVQADIGDKRAFQGSGLGLSISKAYVEMIGGSIWVMSEEGKGSCFYFTLPCGITAEENNPKVSDSQYQKIEKKSARNASGMKILIAEDDEVSELLLTIEAKKIGNEILIAGNGIMAVDICLRNPDIDLIFMDIKMPEMDGYEAIRQIRKFNKDVIIIAQTAYGLAGDREKAFEAGCNDYISKPIMQEKLKAIIRTYFD